MTVSNESQHIVALGGGGFSLEASPVLDDYILGLARRDKPRICFVPTASGDSDNYIVRFYKRFTGGSTEPVHLELFRRTLEDIEGFVKGAPFREWLAPPGRRLSTERAGVPSRTRGRRRSGDTPRSRPLGFLSPVPAGDAEPARFQLFSAAAKVPRLLSE
jgi:hypothetical protein